MNIFKSTTASNVLFVMPKQYSIERLYCGSVNVFLLEGIQAVSNLKMTLQGTPLNIYIFLDIKYFV